MPHLNPDWFYLSDLPEETFTHSHPSWSSDILYQLPPFASASSISFFLHSILCVQFTCLTVLSDNLSPGPLWSSSWSWALYILSTSTSSTSTSYSMHFFTQSSSSLRSTCPYQRSLFCCNAMSSLPSLSLSSLLGSLSFNLTPHRSNSSSSNSNKIYIAPIFSPRPQSEAH